jgi:hypothetical protein
MKKQGRSLHRSLEREDLGEWSLRGMRERESEAVGGENNIKMDHEEIDIMKVAQGYGKMC